MSTEVQTSPSCSEAYPLVECRTLEGEPEGSSRAGHAWSSCIPEEVGHGHVTSEFIWKFTILKWVLGSLYTTNLTFDYLNINRRRALWT